MKAEECVFRALLCDELNFRQLFYFIIEKSPRQGIGTSALQELSSTKIYAYIRRKESEEV